MAENFPSDICLCIGTSDGDVSVYTGDFGGWWHLSEAHKRQRQAKPRESGHEII